MSLHFIGQRFSVSRGGCWQCLPDCRSRLAEALTFSQVAYNGQAAMRREHRSCVGKMPHRCVFCAVLSQGIQALGQ